MTVACTALVGLLLADSEEVAMISKTASFEPHVSDFFAAMECKGSLGGQW
jgi:hypothetical protein